MGVAVAYVAGDIAEALQLPAEGGLLVQGVERGSGAEAAGLRGPRQIVVIGNVEIGVGGDLIMAIDGRPVDRNDAITRALARKRPGDKTGIADLPQWKDTEADPSRSVKIRMMRREFPTWAEALLLLVLLVPSAVFAWENLDMPQFGFQHDDTIYYVCAKAWATGEGHRHYQSAGSALANEISAGISAALVDGLANFSRVSGQPASCDRALLADAAAAAVADPDALPEISVSGMVGVGDDRRACDQSIHTVVQREPA